VSEVVIEQRFARVELVLGIAILAVGAFGLREVWATGQGGPAATVWLFGSTLLIGLGAGAVVGAVLLRRGGALRWGGQLLLLLGPAIAIAFADRVIR
jgi:hypothetical protein